MTAATNRALAILAAPGMTLVMAEGSVQFFDQDDSRISVNVWHPALVDERGVTRHSHAFGLRSRCLLGVFRQVRLRLTPDSAGVLVRHVARVALRPSDIPGIDVLGAERCRVLRRREDRTRAGETYALRRETLHEVLLDGLATTLCERVRPAPGDIWLVQDVGKPAPDPRGSFLESFVERAAPALREGVYHLKGALRGSRRDLPDLERALEEVGDALRASTPEPLAIGSRS